MKDEHPGGIYVHVPFCLRKCPYCGFYSSTDLRLIPEYLNALKTEITLYGKSFRIPCDSIYIGGGTPSVLAVHEIVEIVERLHSTLSVSPDAEITIEVNPGIIPNGFFQGCIHAGVNRISIGVQSFQEDHLHFLGRIHTSADARQTLIRARQAGFCRISMDLIYGLPGQSLKSWEKVLLEATAFSPDHLSCYLLAVEPGTPLDERIRRGETFPIQEKHSAQLFLATTDILNAHGYEQYEISNFSKDQTSRSRHNQKYWNFAPYVGLGPSAHSFNPPAERCWNIRCIDDYVSRLKNGILPTEEKETLSIDQQMMEAVYVGLRQREGIKLAAFQAAFDKDLLNRCKETISYLHHNGYIDEPSDRITLTRKGMLFADSIASHMISCNEWWDF